MHRRQPAPLLAAAYGPVALHVARLGRARFHSLHVEIPTSTSSYYLRTPGVPFKV